MIGSPTLHCNIHDTWWRSNGNTWQILWHSYDKIKQSESKKKQSLSADTYQKNSMVVLYKDFIHWDQVIIYSYNSLGRQQSGQKDQERFPHVLVISGNRGESRQSEHVRSLIASYRSGFWIFFFFVCNSNGNMRLWREMGRTNNYVERRSRCLYTLPTNALLLVYWAWFLLQITKDIYESHRLSMYRTANHRLHYLLRALENVSFSHKWTFLSFFCHTYGRLL